MHIRPYRLTDERAWLDCRVRAFLFSSYATDVAQTRPTYDRPAITLVAIEADQLIGLIDVELAPPEMADCSRPGSMVWNLAVSPAAQHRGIATALWQAAQAALTAQGVRYCELWTQDDVAANQFYQHVGFRLVPSATYLRCFLTPARRSVTLGGVTREYYVETYELQARPAERARLAPHCAKIVEVRLYAQTW